MQRGQSMRKSMRGVTLMELMVVITTIGILASVALPSYRRYVMRTNRTDATAALLRIQQQQEKFFIQNGRYALAAEQTPAPPAGLGIAATSEHGFYAVTLVNGATPTQYSATVTPVAGRGQVADTACASFGINELGDKISSPSAAAICWK
jgi:type IV pilus assembly protein PilE